MDVARVITEDANGEGSDDLSDEDSVTSETDGVEA